VIVRHPKEEISICCVSLTFMATDRILALLLIERDKLTGAIEALQGPITTEETSATVGPTAPVKRKLSAAGRRAIVAATKKRWAATRAAKAAGAAPAQVALTPKAGPARAPLPVKQGGLTEAGRKALSIAMKKQWAAQKKKAAAKGK
jgi:hypothetical protein